ncbi:hypothetical protein Tco_0394980 [Tanacetum coccineum]
MNGNISYLYEYEPYDGGYVSFGHGGGKITGKGTIKTEIRDCYEKKLINVDHIHTDNNVANLLTKPFDVGRF